MNKGEKKAQILCSVSQEWKIKNKVKIYINVLMCEKVYEKGYILQDRKASRNVTFLFTFNNKFTAHRKV